MPSKPLSACLPPLEERFENLVRGYSRLIRAAVSRAGGAGAELHGGEIEQRVLTALWKQVSGEQTIHHPSSYIYRAAVRETLRVLRREQRQEVMTRQAVSLTEATRTEVGPDRALESKELARTIDEVLGELAQDRARAIRAHLAGFKVQEIMSMYGWSYQTARNLVSRGMADLRRGLRKRGIDDPSR
ncbi:MAG: sigma-70 family RNA polymerase sigma factor [Thermoanaerobaculia bacterium]|nr:sigma-70 family RNA polymerase sigma factor [Thermoanaerobaculia bacterium]